MYFLYSSVWQSTSHERTCQLRATPFSTSTTVSHQWSCSRTLALILALIHPTLLEGAFSEAVAKDHGSPLYPASSLLSSPSPERESTCRATNADTTGHCTSGQIKMQRARL